MIGNNGNSRRKCYERSKKDGAHITEILFEGKQTVKITLPANYEGSYARNIAAFFCVKIHLERSTRSPNKMHKGRTIKSITTRANAARAVMTL